MSAAGSPAKKSPQKSVFSYVFGDNKSSSSSAATAAASPKAASIFSPVASASIQQQPLSPLKTAEQSVVNNQRVIIMILVGILTVSLLGSAATSYFFNHFVASVLSMISHLVSTFGYSAGTVINSTANVASNATINGIEVADGAVSSVGDIFRRANEHGAYPNVKHEMDEILHASEKPFLPPRDARSPSSPPPPPQPQQQQQQPQHGDDAELKRMREDLDKVINEVSEKRNARAVSGADGAAAKSDDSALSSIQKPITATKTSFCYLGTFEGKRGCVQLESGDICQYGTLYDTRDQCLALGK